MEQFAEVHYGCGIYVPDVKYIKPEYHPKTIFPWVQMLQALNPKVLEAENSVNQNYHAIESLYQTRLWSIDRNRKCTEIGSDYTGCILPISINNPKIFGGIGHSYQNALNILRDKYGKYLVDDFDYEDHFVQYEIIEI